MSRLKWLGIVLAILVACGYYILFYKTVNKTSISKNADMVISIDVKRNINTILGYYITTPSEWNFTSIFKSKPKDSAVSWKDAITLPDYLFLFHEKDQPTQAFYTILNIKDEQVLNSFFNENEFIKTSNNIFVSNKFSIQIFKTTHQILITSINNTTENLNAVAKEIFEKNEYLSKDILAKIVSPNNHFTLFFDQNKYLKNDVLLNGNFKHGELNIEGNLSVVQNLLPADNNFELNPQSILNIGFVQPPDALWAMVDSSQKSKISTAINFNIDSLMTLNNKKYTLDVASFKTKIDSAISYTYDDDFNKIEKVVVNKIEEPSYAFTAFGNSFNNLINYWKQNKNIEQTNSQNIMVSIPFAKTLVSNTNNSLHLYSDNYVSSPKNQEENGLAFVHFNTTTLPVNMYNYLPNHLQENAKKIEQLNAFVKNEKDLVKLNITLLLKEKNKPFILSFR